MAFSRSTLLGVLVLAASSGDAPAADEMKWEAVAVGSGKMAVPAGWRSFENIKPGMVLFRQGDGIGVPILDDTRSPLQIGLSVEKIEKSKETVKEVVDGLITAAKKAPRLELIGKETVKDIKLSDGAEAQLLTTQFLKEKRRLSLQMKLVVKDTDANVWIVTGFMVGGKDSRRPTEESDLAGWLRAHMTSLTLDPKKFDEEKINKAYRDREKK
jgi:hypothetical protein